MKPVKPKPPIKLTLTDAVRVKLTPRGLEILRQLHDEARARVRESGPPYREPARDAKGWSTFPLWELMQDFGPHIYHGCVNLPFEMKMQIPQAGFSKTGPEPQPSWEFPPIQGLPLPPGASQEERQARFRAYKAACSEAYAARQAALAPAADNLGQK